MSNVKKCPACGFVYSESGSCPRCSRKKVRIKVVNKWWVKFPPNIGDILWH